MALVVQSAVYGGLHNGNQTQCQAGGVTIVLQEAIDRNQGIVTINNDLFGDPSISTKKHFGAVVADEGLDQYGEPFARLNYFACEEGQTIDFNRTEPVSVGFPPHLVADPATAAEKGVE